VAQLRQLTPVLLDEFVASCPRTRARSVNHLVGVLGCFLDWAVTQQRLPVSPLHRTRRRQTDQRLPFLFDLAQARRLLAAAAALPDNARAVGRGPAAEMAGLNPITYLDACGRAGGKPFDET
jgi:site-specific recombinase XerC